MEGFLLRVRWLIMAIQLREEGGHYRAKDGSVFANAKSSINNRFKLIEAKTGKEIYFTKEGVDQFCSILLVEEIEWHQIPCVFDKPVLCWVFYGDVKDSEPVMIYGYNEVDGFISNGLYFVKAIPCTTIEIDALKSPYF